MKRAACWVVLGLALLGLSSLVVQRPGDMPASRRIPAAAATQAAEALPREAAPVLAATEAAEQDAPVAAASAAPAVVDPPQAAPADVDPLPFPGSHVDPKRITALHGTAPLNAKHPHVASAIAVQERNTASIMANPAVVGTAVGLNDEGQVAIVIMTKTEASGLPTILENTPVVVWNSGDVFARNHPDQDAANAQDRAKERAKSSGGKPGSTPLSQSRFKHPVPIGVSTSLPTVYTYPYITAGTLGCRVKIGSAVYALSNNHVFANESTVDPGAIVLQPGTLDGGTDADFYGSLWAASTIVFTTSASNKVDAAIALSDPDSLGNATPTGGYGTPSSTSVPDDLVPLGVPVTKYGRTTGQTSALVSGLNATVSVQYDAGVARFVGQVVIGSRSFSAAGDSGSLIVQSADHQAVGLLFAGSRTTTFANPIGAVLDTFGVTIDGH